MPLVLRGPGFDTGRRNDALVTLLDVVPTLVVAAGGDDPQLDGRPLQQHGNVREHVFVQISESQVGRAVRTVTHTYSVRAPGHDPRLGRQHSRSDVYGDDKLYDNVADPYQRHNLVKDPALADVRQDLADRLLEQIHQIEDHLPRLVDRPT